MRARFRPFGALTVIVSGSLLLGLAVVSPAVAEEDYPSWDEVEQARQDEASAAAAVRDIQNLLVGLEIRSADLAREAQAQAEAYNAARNELDAATARADGSTRRRRPPGGRPRPPRCVRANSSPASPARAAAT